MVFAVESRNRPVIALLIAALSLLGHTLQATETCSTSAESSAESSCSTSKADASTASTSPSPRKEWKWDPTSLNHRCDIRKITHAELTKEFGPRGLPPLYHEPLVIIDDSKSTTGQKRHNQHFAEMTTPQAIVDYFPPDFIVTLSSSNSFSAHRRKITLKQYISEQMAGSGETYPTTLSNETWYLFGETYSDDWKKLLSHFELPPCQTCTSDLSALAFGIGNIGSGVQWHVHGPGFSESIHGRKHWILYPPHKQPTYDPDFTSRHWMEEVYTSIGKESEMPWECTLEPGDMIYFPDHWYHATINLDRYTAFVSTFTTEHINVD